MQLDKDKAKKAAILLGTYPNICQLSNEQTKLDEWWKVVARALNSK